MAENNATILNKIWLNGSTNYQQNVPRVTQGNISQTVEFFQNPNSRPFWNEFVDALVNRIGEVVIRSRRWENPLAPLKRGMLMYGNTIEEVGANLIKPKTYDPCAIDLLDCNPPEFKSAFHHRNFEWKFPITVNEVELRRAFLSEYGLNDFVNSIMDIPYNSNSQAEYDTMVNLFATYEQKWGFYKVQTPDLSVDTDITTNARKVLRLLRAYTRRLSFQRPYYNAYGLPVFSRPEDMLLIMTPDVEAAIDVEGLAPLFHLEPAEMQTRQVIVDEFPVNGAQAALVDRDWFICADSVFENTSFYNPSTLTTNHWLHHQGIMSMSPMLNAVLFTLEEGTGLTTVTVTVTGATIAFAEKEDGTTPEFAPVGEDTQLEVTAIGTVAPEDSDVHVPDGAYLTITASDKALAPHTYVTNDGVLHVDPDETATNVTVQATLSYIDPDNPISGQTPKTASMVVGIGAKYVPPTE